MTKNIQEMKQVLPEELGEFNNLDVSEKYIIFSAENCEPCKKITQELEQISLNEGFDYSVFMCKFSMGNKVHSNIISEIGIKFWPTIFYFKDGSFKKQIRGLRPKTNNSYWLSIYKASQK